MNMNVVRAVWKRDLKSWFGNPTGYVFIILFVSLSTVALMWSEAFFTNNLANLDTLNDWFPLLAIGFVAASTMNCWATERATGTQELLFTLPGRDFDLQLGKFLAAASVYTVSLLFTLVLPIALSFLGNPDWGQLFANYVGYWLFGLMLVSVSMVGSQLTQNGTVALILACMLCASVVYIGKVMGWVVGWAVYMIGIGDADRISKLLGFANWQSNGPIGQFQLFAGGEITMSGLLLFVGLTVAFFYLGLALLARRQWRSAEPALHGGLRFFGLGVSALALTIVGEHLLPRIDTTVEGIHSLGAETRQLIDGLSADRPVYITAYVSDKVPEQFVQQRKLLLNLIDQFDAIGGGAIEKNIIIPEPYSEEARYAEDNFGIRPQRVTMQLPAGGVADVQMFFGYAVQSGTEKVVNPFVMPGVPLEYELMRSVRTVSQTERQKVGILKTDVELFGGFDMQTFQQKPRWSIAQELEQQYEIVNVDPTGEYPSEIACLIVPQPSSLEQEPMDKLQQWILGGHKVVLFEDPAPLSAWGTAADDEKGGMQARMMGGGGGPQKGNWQGFLRAIGVDAPVGEVVWDLSYRTFPGGRISQEFVFVHESGMSTDSAITKGLQNVVSMMGGHVAATGAEGFTFKPLLTSLGPARTNEANGIVPKMELFQFNPFGGGPQLNPYARRQRRNDDLTLAARVTKKAEGDVPGVDLIYVADLDMIGNQFFQLRQQVLDPNVRFDNVTFALNCIDTLVGDTSLIELRKRRPLLRKLTAVEEAQRVFEDTWQKQKDDAEEAAKKSLEEAQARLDEAVDQIRNDATLDTQAKEVKVVQVQQQESRKLELVKAQIDEQKNKKLEEAQFDRDEARNGICNRYKIMTALLSVLPGVLLGLFTFFRRASRAAAIVPQSRRVGSHGGA